MDVQVARGSGEQPKRQPEVIETIEMLERQICLLEQSGSNLFERIRIVRREEPTPESTEKASKIESSCELAAVLTRYANRIRLFRETIEYQLSVIEL